MSSEPNFFDSPRFRAAIARFDAENARDPNVETVAGVTHPRELLYSQRLTEWVHRLAPNASEAVRLAARCQHICRWEIPREAYPATRPGYLKWREDLKQFHAQKAGEILRELGYEESLITRVQALNRKKGFPADPDTRLLEDALCLVFLEHQLGPLAAKATEDKVLNALRKSWAKMTPTARDIALALPLSSAERELIRRALQTG